MESAAEGEPEVVLVSQEGEQLKVPKDVACASLLVKEMIEDGDDSMTVPLPMVKTETLKKVIAYCKHHLNNPPEEIPAPLPTSNLAEVVSEWDARFISVDHSRLFDLLTAADYLNIPSLLLLTSAKLASLLKGKTPEEIRRTFNIVNDFTPEEEAQIREENRWCEDA